MSVIVSGWPEMMTIAEEATTEAITTEATTTETYTTEEVTTADTSLMMDEEAGTA